MALHAANVRCEMWRLAEDYEQQPQFVQVHEATEGVFDREFRD